MKSAIVLLMLLIYVAALPVTEGAPDRRSLDITSVAINLSKTDAEFTVNYELDVFTKMYVLLMGGKSIEPKIKSVFSNFDYEITKLDTDRTVLWVKNFSRYDKGYYLHDSHVKFGEGIKTLYVYTPDSPDPKKYSSIYLFSWDRVPGNESNKLLNSLRYDLNIDWAGNGKILKTEDDQTIRIFNDKSSIEITLENKKKALLKTSDGRTYELLVKGDNGNRYIYSPLIYSTPNIYYRS